MANSDTERFTPTREGVYGIGPFTEVVDPRSHDEAMAERLRMEGERVSRESPVGSGRRGITVPGPDGPVTSYYEKGEIMPREIQGGEPR